MGLLWWHGGILVEVSKAEKWTGLSRGLQTDLSQVWGPAVRFGMLSSNSQRSCQVAEAKGTTCIAFHSEKLSAQRCELSGTVRPQH